MTRAQILTMPTKNRWALFEELSGVDAMRVALEVRALGYYSVAVVTALYGNYQPLTPAVIVDHYSRLQ